MYLPVLSRQRQLGSPPSPDTLLRRVRLPPASAIEYALTKPVELHVYSAYGCRSGQSTPAPPPRRQIPACSANLSSNRNSKRKIPFPNQPHACRTAPSNPAQLLSLPPLQSREEPGCTACGGQVSATNPAHRRKESGPRTGVEASQPAGLQNQISFTKESYRLITLAPGPPLSR